MPDAATASRPAATATSRTTDLALVAFFAALIAACAILPAVPIGEAGVPLTLQTFAVLLAGAVLGSVRGGLAALLYVVVGLAGVPVFAGGAAGVGVLAGPSVGYIIAFPLQAYLVGFIVERIRSRRLASAGDLIFAACLLSIVAVTFPLGAAGIAWRAQLDPSVAIKAAAIYIPADALKAIVVAFVAASVHRAFPDLIARRRPRP